MTRSAGLLFAGVMGIIVFSGWVLVARMILVANAYLEAHRPLIARAAAAARDLRRAARARSGGS